MSLRVDRKKARDAIRFLAEIKPRLQYAQYGGRNPEFRYERNRKAQEALQISGSPNLEHLRQVYSETEDVAKEALKKIALRIGERTHVEMVRIRNSIAKRYLTSGEKKQLDRLDTPQAKQYRGLARALAAYTVTSCSENFPYPVIAEDRLRITPPAVNPLASPRATNSMSEVGRAFSQMAGNTVPRWSKWSTSRNRIGVELAKKSYGGVSDDEFATVVNSSHPVIGIITAVSRPEEIWSILTLDPIERNQQLEQIIREVEAHLRKSSLDFLKALEERDWETVGPLLDFARDDLFPDLKLDRSERIICDSLTKDIKGWSVRDVLTAAVIAASLAIAVLSMGSGAGVVALAFRASVGIDISSIGADLLITYNENQERKSINSYVALNQNLKAAAAPDSLALRAAFAAGAMFLGYYAVPALLKRVSGGGAVADTPSNFTPEKIPDEPLVSISPPEQSFSNPAAPDAMNFTEPNTGALRGGSDEAAQSRLLDDSRMVGSRSISENPPPITDREIDEAFAEWVPESGVSPAPAVSASISSIDIPLTADQMAKLAQILGRTWGAAGGDALAPRIMRRLAEHWDSALPRRGQENLAEAVLRVFNRVQRRAPDNINRYVRRILFSLWRRRFITRVNRDPQLVADLASAGIIFRRSPGRGRNSFSLRAEINGETHWIGLDIDHAFTRHEDAIIRAFDPATPRAEALASLESTVSSSNLQFLTARENQVAIEALRRDAFNRDNPVMLRLSEVLERLLPGSAQ